MTEEKPAKQGSTALLGPRRMSTLALEANIENKMQGLKKMGEKTPVPVATP